MLWKSEAGVGEKSVKLVVMELRTIIGRETLPKTKDRWDRVPYWVRVGLEYWMDWYGVLMDWYGVQMGRGVLDTGGTG